MLHFLMKIISLFKILFYKLIFHISFPSWSVIFWFPKINNWKLIKIWKWFQLWRLSRLQWKITIWKNFFMNEFWSISAWIDLKWEIIIWDNVMIGPFFYMISKDHDFSKWKIFNIWSEWKSWKIKIWNNVWIWARVTILKWLEIWDNVVIWAWSVVTKNIPSNSLAVWNPCKVIREI